MKYILLSHNLILILLVVLISFHSNGKVTAQDIRIVPSKLYVKNDSLHVNLTIYPNGISVGSGTAFFFTPVISERKKQSLSLPGRYHQRQTPCPPGPEGSISLARQKRSTAFPADNSRKKKTERSNQLPDSSAICLLDGNTLRSCSGRNTKNVAKRSSWHSIR